MSAQNTTTEARYQTREVLGGAYVREGQPMRTHVYDTVEGRVICNRVKSDNLADQYASTDEELAAPATCKTCCKRDPRTYGER